MDLLSEVNLTPEAFAAYGEFCRRIALAFGDIADPSQIPDEQARLGDRGQLAIFIELPNDAGKIEFEIPPGQWAWRNQN